jgi:hypothetical protein
MADMYGNNYGMPYGAVGVNPNPQFYNYDPAYGQPMVMNQQPNYMAKPTLSKEEMDAMANKPGNGLDLMNIPVEESYAGICNHIGNDGREHVHRLPDGTCECDICRKRWDPSVVTKEEVQDTTEKMINYMQNVKFANVLPVQTVRDYFTLIPLLAKFPAVYEYTMKQVDRQMNGSSLYGAAPESSMYAQYRNVMYNAPYQQPMYGGYQQPVYQQPMGYYNQPQQPYAQPAQPGVNPMDINAGQVQNPMNYAAAPQPQAPVYPQQPMNGYYGQQQPMYAYQQPMQPAAPYAPQPQMAPNYAPAPQPKAPAPAQTTTPDGATVQNNGDGTASSSKKITLA